jgi:uncharacterized metal-binding protein
MNRTTSNKPLVYPCSGCTGAAQMSNYLALQLDRMEIDKMCLLKDVGVSLNPFHHERT